MKILKRNTSSLKAAYKIRRSNETLFVIKSYPELN